MTTPKQLLHHYTSGTGLLGIFDSDSIWATYIHSLNDSSEFGHAIDETRTYMLALRQNSNDERKNALNAALADSLERISSFSVYVACFSAVDDSLSQWRGYCPPGFGYSIGFVADELRQTAATQGFALHQCIYDQGKKRQIISAWVNDSIAALEVSLPSQADPQDHVSRECYRFFQTFASFAPAMKDSAFEGEDEWRLVGLISSNDRRIRLRSGKSMLIRYIPIELHMASNQRLLWHIRVGPTPNLTLALDTTLHFFQRAHLNNGIKRSMIPYREW